MLYITQCENDGWWLETWKRANPTDTNVCPYRCRSWRHDGDCRHHRNSQDWARIMEVLPLFPCWTHIVLTYDQHSTRNIYHTYKAGFLLWSVLRKRIVRRYGELVYIQMWERHKDGVPHCHMALCNRYLFENCHYNKGHHEKAYGHWNFEEHLGEMAVACGFGERGWLEPIRHSEKMASYLVKLADEMSDGSEKDQAPTNAPKGFRRFRASVGLLSPILQDPSITGRLLALQDEGEMTEIRKKGGMDAPPPSGLHPDTNPVIQELY